MIGRFVEHNNQEWQSVALRTATGTVICGLTHPGIADWTNADTDPGQMVHAALSVGREL